MMPPPSRVARRVLAVILLLAVPALAYVGAVMPVEGYYRGLVREAATLEETLARYRALGGDHPAVAAELRSAEAEVPDAALYLTGASDALAAAQLQELLNGIVREGGGSVDSVRVMESAEEGPYRRISVQLLVASRIDALRTILHGIETGKPYLFVKSMGVANVTGGRPGSALTQPAELDIHLEVFGYRKGGAS